MERPAEGPAAGTAPPDREFRPELQGLRALAVALVVVYHVWLGRVSGGVDVFFLDLRLPDHRSARPAPPTAGRSSCGRCGAG